ncbi:MAG: HEAT repeat domain-containing protein [Nitrospirae bacterium]|nr:HEAT repeat domain-containing protein [Nitrospirota bacterium]
MNGHQLTKQDIEQAKQNKNYSFFTKIFSSESDSTRYFVLRKIGRLPRDFPFEVFTDLVKTSNHNIRVLLVKNLGKSENPSFIDLLSRIAATDTNSNVRRECVSSIGRIGTQTAISILLKFLEDRDSRVVVQAIRGLLPFRHNKDVKSALQKVNLMDDEVVGQTIKEMISDKQKVKVKQPLQTIHNGFTNSFSNTLICGDCRKILKQVPDNVLHLCFTSPPYYNAKDYSIYRSYKDYLDFLTRVFREVYRVLQEGRFFILNTSPVLVPRMSRKHQSQRYLIPFDIHPCLIDIGFDFIDDIIWVKPEPSAKNRNGGFLQHRKPLAYKANSVCEYVIVYRKHTNKLIDWNLRQYSNETVEKSKVRGEYEKSNVWHIAPSTSKFHPAVFPKELTSNVIKFYSFTDDIIFDPFAGSGTVGTVACELGRKFFLIEKEESYCDNFLKLSPNALFTKYLSQNQFLEELQRMKLLNNKITTK